MLRAAVIGAGWFAAQNHIPVLAQRADVLLDGVSRLGAGDLERVRDHFGFAFASEDYRDVLARGPDIAIVASPHHLHHEHARAALECGAHVLVEKPMTVDPADAWDLVATARRTERHLVVANGYHYLQGLEPVRAAIARLGTIEHASCRFVSATRPVFSGTTGFRRWRETFFRPDVATWQDPAHGGGFAYGQLSHSIAMLLWLTGLRAERVSAQAWSDGEIDLHDSAAVRFSGSAVGSIDGGAGVPEEGRARLRIALTGGRGMLDLDVDLDRCVLELNDGTCETIGAPQGGWHYSCEGPVNCLCDLATGHGENLSPGEIGARTVEIIAAMRLSAARHGESIAIASRSEERRPSG